MNSPIKVKLPYFDHLLAALQEDNDALEKSFGRHVHWGYWQQPKLATLSVDDFAEAAENLSIQVCDAAKISSHKTILDVGCGFGGTIAHLNENYDNLELLGLNLDDRQLQRAQQKVKPLANNSIQFQQGNACSLPFPDNSFDVVLAVECIFHFPDRQTFFAEAFRVLKPGGYLALSDFGPTTALLPLVKIKLPKPLGQGFYGNCNVECSSAGYRQLAAETGFKLTLEKDITRNTLPTYRYLRSMGMKESYKSISAAVETLLVEVLSRTHLLKYLVLSFQKPQSSD
jgi:ubiquinone/menaquinone biosynthesis C-methylase UbiE